jgi:signal transduction histidine kinase/CheY-like chemotaxis protein
MKHHGNLNTLPRYFAGNVHITRLILALSLLFSVFGALPALAENSAAGINPKLNLEKVVLQLKWLHQFQFAGYYAAKELGYYERAGLDVEIRQRGRGIDICEEVVSGRADYGVMGNDVVLKYMNGRPLVVMAALFQHSPVAIISTKESGISTPQDLLGRRLMWQRGFGLIIPIMLMHEGIPLDKISLHDFTYDINDLTSGKVDAMAAYITEMPYHLEKAGIPYNIIYPHHYGAHFYGDCLVTSKATAENHTQRTQRFLEASLKGWKYAMDNPDEIVRLLKSKYPSRNTSEQLLYEAKAMRELMLPDLIELGHMNPGRWQSMADSFVKLGEAKAGYSMEGLFFRHYTVPDHTWLWIGILAVMALGALCVSVAAIMFLFNRRLQKAVRQRTYEISKSNKQLEQEIAERRKTEIKLKKAKEAAEVANLAKSQFLANMTHEVRTPMNTIIGMTELALDGELDPQQREFLSLVRVSGDNLMSIINDLIDLSTFESGKYRLIDIEFNLRDILLEEIRSFALKAKEKKIELILHIQPSVPGVLQGDPIRLQQVVSNLLSNSIKFSNAGEVLLTTGVVGQKGNRIKLKFNISDSGIGINEDKQSIIFEPFIQADGSNTRHFGGTGLGLTICKHLVSLMGGEISLDSSPGMGSSFEFTAWFGYQPDTETISDTHILETAGAVSSVREQLLSGIKVLLAEDDPVNRKFVQNLLESMGGVVTPVYDGVSAVETFKVDKYDLILMDMDMPGMDGLSAARQIQDYCLSQLNCHIPVVALTSYAMPGDMEKLLKAGMDGYLANPIGKDNLLSVIQDVLSSDNID